MTNSLKLKAGEWVQVRSKDEILKTLDKKGQLDGMPFMPEMLDYCGQRLRVYKRAHKTCDTATGSATGVYKGRKMQDAVHLDGIRCNGQSHGGCEAGCLIFWKEAWLRRSTGPGNNSRLERDVEISAQRNGVSLQCNEEDILQGAHSPGEHDTVPAYVCQATQVPAATEPLLSSDWKQYLEDFTSGNVSLGRMTRGFVYMGYRHWLINSGLGLGPALRWLYDRFQTLFGGPPYPRREGRIPLGGQTPSACLDLQPGELVRVKSYEAILATCDASNKNRGMVFDAEMVPYCGRTYRVLRRVHKILNEKTGRMQQMKTACIILEGVVCQSRYSECRLFCPRSVYPYWREIWLERISERVPGPDLGVLTASQKESVSSKPSWAVDRDDYENRSTSHSK